VTHQRAALRGRLEPERWYPAGETGITQRFVRTGFGTRVRVVEAGPADGDPVLLVHGWGCSVYGYRRVIPALAEAGHRVVAFDLKGHGLSEKPAGESEYTRDAMRDHVIDVLDALGIDHVSLLVGHSMGGAIAGAVAGAVPGRVDRLALLAPVGFGKVWAVAGARLLTPTVVSPALARLFGRWTVAATLRLAFSDRSAREAGDVDQYWAPSQFPEYIAALRHLVHSFDWDAASPDELRRISAPTLLMVGTHDRIIRWRDVESLTREIPGATVRFVSGSGHVLPEERPREVNDALIELLAVEPAGGAPRALTAER
jgi:pimeloyl-ACP methyl ester carboxylesterase